MSVIESTQLQRKKMNKSVTNSFNIKQILVCFEGITTKLFVEVKEY